MLESVNIDPGNDVSCIQLGRQQLAFATSDAYGVMLSNGYDSGVHALEGGTSRFIG